MQNYVNYIASTKPGSSLLVLMPYATCSVYVAGSYNLATLYIDDGVTPQANPFLSSSTGKVSFFAANGLYDIVVSKTGYEPVTIPNVELDDLLASSGSNSVGYLPAGTGAVARTVQGKLRDTVSVTDFGAVGNGVVDDTAAIQAALNYAAPLGYAVFFPPGTYRTTATVGFSRTDTERFGVQIIGSGAQYTFIYADHTAGPALSLNRSAGRVQDISINASATRTAAAAGTNYGLLMEAPDNATAAVALMTIIRVKVYGHPSHGIVHVGNMIESYYEQVNALQNGGHGYVFDGGQITSRTNQFYPGIVTLLNCWATSNTGHAVKIGDPSDVSAALPLRFAFINFEASDNALTAGVRLTADECWIRGTQMTFDTCAMGRSSGGAVIGCIRFAGEHLQIRNQRAVTTTHTLRLEADHSLASTFGIRINGLRVLNNAQNPVVIVSSLTAVRDIQIQTNGDQSNMTSMFTVGALRATWDYAPPIMTAIKTATQTVNNSAVLVDDNKLQVYLQASESVAFDAIIRYSGDSAADIVIAFVAPSGATVRWDNEGSSYITTGDVLTVSNSEIIEGATRSFGAVAGTRTLNLRGWVVMSTTPGALKMQFAQNVATAANTNVLVGSMLRVYRPNTNV